MEDYKKKYEEALENLKKIRNANENNKELVDFIEYKYPELKESKDIKISKAIFKALSKKDARDVLLENGVQVSDALAWLEKQKDHEDELEKAYKTADEVQYRKGFEDGVASVKPVEWSEEDEKIFNTVIEKGDLKPSEIDWLKSLKEKMKG